MIWEWIDNCKGFCFSVRHFFRKFVCKNYYKNSHGLPMCKLATKKAPCEWWWCPKRKDGEA